MGIISKLITISVTVAGLSIFSQAPEFAQQYRQRLGGAIDELKSVVTAFDLDAKRSNMTRDEALTSLKNSVEAFPRDRGYSMEKSILRFSSLQNQSKAIEESHVLLVPLKMVQGADRQIIQNTMKSFEPAVPLNQQGLVYGGVGAFFGFLLARFILSFSSLNRRKRNDRSLETAIKREQEFESQNGLNEATKVMSKPGLLADSPAQEQLARGNSNHSSLLTERVRGEVDAKGMVVGSNKHH